MMLGQRVSNVSFESFHEHTTGKKVVLMYPWTNYRTIFLTNFLANAKHGLLYYRLRADNVNLPEFLSDLVQEIGEVLVGFGNNIQEALPSGDPEQLGAAFSADLAAFNDQRLILFIDEFDRLTMNDRTNRFITAWINSLPDHVRIALSSRMMTYQPWSSLIKQGLAVVLGNEQRRSDLTFVVESRPKPQLEVFALGRGDVFINGQEISSWEGILPRQLFFYLMDHPLVTRDQIFVDFWPGLSVKDATDIFHVTKHKITEVIGRKMHGSKDYEITSYKQGFYIPSAKVVRHYDVENFHDAAERALQATSEKETESFLTRALELYQGPYLEGNEAKWVVTRRDQLALEYSEILIAYARIVMQRGETRRALEMYLKAQTQRPEREDVYRALIEIYLQMGRRDEAMAQFRTLEKRLKQEYGIRPSPETMALVEGLRA